MSSSATVLSRRVLLGFVLAGLTACGDDPDTPYLDYAGGGFVFNYRTANHFYGFVVRQKKPLPEGARITVRFELPGDRQQVVEERTTGGRLQYKFQTGDIEGIEVNHPYRAVLVLSDASGTELQRLEKTFQTDVDQSRLPSKPLVVGPGYEPSPP